MDGHLICYIYLFNVSLYPLIPYYRTKGLSKDCKLIWMANRMSLFACLKLRSFFVLSADLQVRPMNIMSFKSAAIVFSRYIGNKSKYKRYLCNLWVTMTAISVDIVVTSLHHNRTFYFILVCRVLTQGR